MSSWSIFSFLLLPFCSWWVQKRSPALYLNGFLRGQVLLFKQSYNWRGLRCTSVNFNMEQKYIFLGVGFTVKCSNRTPFWHSMNLVRSTIISTKFLIHASGEQMSHRRESRSPPISVVHMLEGQAWSFIKSAHILSDIIALDCWLSTAGSVQTLTPQVQEPFFVFITSWTLVLDLTSQQGDWEVCGDCRRWHSSESAEIKRNEDEGGDFAPRKWKDDGKF